MFDEILRELGIEELNSGVAGYPGATASGALLRTINPATEERLPAVQSASLADYEAMVAQACLAFPRWRSRPAPARGEAVRRIGEALRRHKRALGMLVTLEVGKIRSEGEGEVQEMIDMCDFAVGLSRQLHGLTIASERPHHRMMEQWHPLGPVGVLSAFNFPVAVWAWNAFLAAVCGDVVLWKPSPRAPLSAVAVARIVQEATRGLDCEGVFNLAVAGAEIGERMAADPRVPLVSATGSCAMGKRVGQIVAHRMGRALLELGGNNAIVIAPSATLELAIRATAFAAVGTAGQRCTTARRLIVHESLHDKVVARLQAVYKSLPIGDPWDDRTLVGPLVSEAAVQAMQTALETARSQGGQVVAGGARLARKGYFVEPALVLARPDMPIVGVETFAPVLYIMNYRSFEQALAIHNSVEQGLSSAIFTNDLREAERFVAAEGSDCGIANVNIGTSGAEIGGAFGGEKTTGGGREAGSDSWKAYMRRQTCTINRGDDLPLAQGVKFDVG